MLSNSRTQKIHIDNMARDKGFSNVEVVTGDVNVYDFEQKGQSVDRISHLSCRYKTDL